MLERKNSTVLEPVLMILSKVCRHLRTLLSVHLKIQWFLRWFLVWNDADYERYACAEANKTDKVHYTFAEKLRDALRHSDTNFTDSTDDSYAVDISISGSDADEGIRFATL